MDTRWRDFYAKALWESRKLSEHEHPEAALIIREDSCFCLSIKNAIFNGKSFYNSPIQDVILKYVGVYKESVPAAIFTSYFPTYNELLLILEAGIHTIYFFGDITDPEASKLLNYIKKEDIFKDLEIKNLV